jgi:hypothetical protein
MILIEIGETIVEEHLADEVNGQSKFHQAFACRRRVLPLDHVGGDIRVRQIGGRGILTMRVVDQQFVDPTRGDEEADTERNEYQTDDEQGGQHRSRREYRLPSAQALLFERRICHERIQSAVFFQHTHALSLSCKIDIRSLR